MEGRAKLLVVLADFGKLRGDGVALGSDGCDAGDSGT